jgi:hypothetical protein
MSFKEIQPAMDEYTCDSCFAKEQGTVRPFDWTGVEVEGFIDGKRGRGRYLDLCPNCSRLERFAWILELEPAVIPPMTPIGQ